MAWRNLRREKISTVLNITGLALGMATALLIMLWVNDELSYDKFNLNYDRIHRVVGRFELNEKYEHPNAPPAMAEVMFKEFPGVELTLSVSRLWSRGYESWRQNFFGDQHHLYRFHPSINVYHCHR